MLPDVFVIRHPNEGTIRFSFQNVLPFQFQFMFEPKSSDVMSMLSSLCRAHSTRRAQCMHRELKLQGLYDCLIQVVLQYY